MLRIFALAAFVAVASLTPVHAADAADARSPYGHVDHRSDAGNDTGNAQVDALNRGQLDENYHPPGNVGAPSAAQTSPLPAYQPGH